jgi:DNA-binding GntR family transcriptional regulator
MVRSSSSASPSSNFPSALPLAEYQRTDDDQAGAQLSSTALRLRHALVNLMLSGEISAGKRLDQRQLAKRLNTTTAPLREALTALQSEGLLVRQPGMGVFCRVYTVLEIEELVEIRGVLESLAARRATAHISDQDIAELREIARQLAEPFAAGGEKAFVKAHVDFHKRIVRISRSPRLEELLGYHRVIDDVLANIAPSLWGNEPHDHMGIVEALASRNPQRAEDAMRSHIAPTYQKRFAALRQRFGEGLIFPTGVVRD